ncbi:uncharacterized protein [Argopecten irradians]|uniref:uncharacterized protein isoform X4 n=1 Tax=Argopecten irradians TaxID=31199 RepID=UPI00371213B3
MSENNYTLHSGMLERITKDTKGKEKREELWAVLKRNNYMFFFTDRTEHTIETHIGKLPINVHTVFTRREKEEKKYGGYIFTIFARDKSINIESNVKFKTNKKSIMEQWRGYISILAKDMIPHDLDLPTDTIQEMDFVLAELRRSTREPGVQRSERSRFSIDSGITHDSVSSVTVTTQRTSASGGSGGSGGSSAPSIDGRSGKRHKFSNNPEGDDVYPSWFISDCSRDKAMNIFTKVGTRYGNTLMRESAQAASHGTYVISYCSSAKDRIPVCDHFKVLRTRAGFRIDVEEKHPDMTNLTDVMMFFIKLNGADRTQSLTTNDLTLLGLVDSGYATYLPDKVDQPPRHSAAIPRNIQFREDRDRQNSEPPPGKVKRRDYDYEAPVSNPRPKTVTGATLQNEMKKYNMDQGQTREPVHSNRHFHPDMKGSNTVAPMRRGGRSELPKHTRVSMPDPTQLKQSPQSAAPWHRDFHVNTTSPPKQREETPPPPCEATSPLGYENDKPDFDKNSSRNKMDGNRETPPPNYKAPAPPPNVHSGAKRMAKAPPSFKAPQSPPKINETAIPPAPPVPGIPAPPPPPPIIGSSRDKLSQSPIKKHTGSLVTGRKKRLLSGDFDDVEHRFPNARRPTAPNIWGMPGSRNANVNYQDARMKQMRSQSVPNLANQLKGVKLSPPQKPINLDEKVTTSFIQRNPPRTVLPKQSVSFDSGNDRSGTRFNIGSKSPEVSSNEPEVDGSHPGGVGTITRKFGQMITTKKDNANPPRYVPTKPPPILPSPHSGPQVYANSDIQEEVYMNDQTDDLYVNDTVDGVKTPPVCPTHAQYVNTTKAVAEPVSSSSSGVETSGKPSVQALKKKLNLEAIIGGSAGKQKPEVQKVISPPAKGKRDIPLPAIPTEAHAEHIDEIYDFLEEG